MYRLQTITDPFFVVDDGSFSGPRHHGLAKPGGLMPLPFTPRQAGLGAPLGSRQPGFLTNFLLQTVRGPAVYY